MSESFGSIDQYHLIVVSGDAEAEFDFGDVICMPADEFSSDFLPLFTHAGTSLLKEWERFLDSPLSTATIHSREILKGFQNRGVTHVAIDPRADNPGRLVAIGQFIAGLGDSCPDAAGNP